MTRMTVAPGTPTPVQRWVRRIARTVGVVRTRPRAGLRVLLYHAVGTDVPGDRYGMSVTQRAFSDQMQWLRDESGCAIVSLESGAARLARRELTGTAVAVTFDDGYLDVLSEAAPVLDRCEIPFTVFVVGSYLERPPTARLYLDTESLRELAAVPSATIGAHGYTHRPLSRLSDEVLDDELRAVRQGLAEHLGAPPSAIAYPHGAVDRRVIDRVKAAGFQLGATSFVGVNQPNVSPLSLRRTELLASDGVDEFAGKIRGDYDWYQVRQRVYWPVPA